MRTHIPAAKDILRQVMRYERPSRHSGNEARILRLGVKNSREEGNELGEFLIALLSGDTE